jgi:hypothetical protein
MASHPSHMYNVFIYFATSFTPRTRAVTTHPGRAHIVHAQPHPSYPPACLRRRRLTFGPFSLSRACSITHSIAHSLASNRLTPTSHHRRTTVSPCYDDCSLSVQGYTAAKNLPKKRQGHGCVALSDGRVLVFGGRNGKSIYNDAHIFSPADNTFKQVRYIPIPRPHTRAPHTTHPATWPCPPAHPRRTPPTCVRAMCRLNYSCSDSAAQTHTQRLASISALCVGEQVEDANSACVNLCFVVLWPCRSLGLCRVSVLCNCTQLFCSSLCGGPPACPPSPTSSSGTYPHRDSPPPPPMHASRRSKTSPSSAMAQDAARFQTAVRIFVEERVNCT